MRSARAIPSGLLGRVNSVQSTDPDVTMEGLALPDSADRCAALHVKATESTPAIMVFRIRVDGRGQALESELVRATPPLSEPARACFVEALRAARTSCTATGQEAQIETQLRYDYLAPAPRPR